MQELVHRLQDKSGPFVPEKPEMKLALGLAFGKYGFIRGIQLTASRLHRCRPPYGGVDEP